MNSKTLRSGKHRDKVPTGSEEATAINRLEQIIGQDIAGRGLATVPGDNLLTRCQGNLAAAAQHLAAEGGSVGIATGFYKAGAEGPTVETDGPCGAIALAWVLGRLGMDVTLLTDPIGASAIAAGTAAAPRHPRTPELLTFPFENDDPSSPERGSNELAESVRSLEFTEEFFRSGPGGQLTHLIAIERPGPNHTAGSQAAKTAEERRRFDQLCPPEHQNQAHDFQGRIITPYTAKIHLLFEFVPDNCLAVRTVGIGDGGNEIGMGAIPWQVLHANVAGGFGARIACRVPTDWTITAGVSNWGAYALAAAVAYLRGQGAVLAEWTDDCEKSVLAALVEQGAAIDGMTRRRELTVDSIPLEQHLAIWAEIRQVVG